MKPGKRLGIDFGAKPLGVTCALVAACVAAVGVPGAFAQDVTVLGVQYRTDHLFPEYQCFWNDAGYPDACGTTSPIGGSAHVYLKNNGAANLTIQNVEMSGVSLQTALTQFTQSTTTGMPASIYLANSAGLITSQQLTTLVNAGEPVWYKLQPSTIPPGGTGQVVVRLRQTTTAPSINLNVIHSSGSTAVAVPVQLNQPWLGGITFSPDLTRVYLYWRHSQPGQAPVQVFMDGDDVTASTTTVADPGLRLTPSVLQLASPLTNGSFHVFKGVFADGQSAAAGLRVWANSDIIYGVWGAEPGTATQTDIAIAYLQDISDHLINTVVQSLNSQAVQTYLKTTEGKQLAASLGIGFVIDAPNKWGVSNPKLFFTKDEPDSGFDPNVSGLPDNKKVGTMGQWLVSYASTYLGLGNPTAVLNITNVDNTYKPYNFYNYGQLSDVMSVDPYYQIRVRKAYHDGQWRIPLYEKADYVYAMAQAGAVSAEPNPLHIVLYACAYTESGNTFPFPTPQCKRIEMYYALAAGAKSFSYWWYPPTSPAYGVGADRFNNDAAARLLWNEIAMLGAEARTAGPVVARSTPADLGVEATPGLWVRSLVAGLDTVVLLVVNDDYSNTNVGITYTPISRAQATVTLPAWMQAQSASAFEISSAGLRDVDSQLTGGQLRLSLGPVALTRMIVITSDPQLRDSLAARYSQQYEAKVQGVAGAFGACCLSTGGGSHSCTLTTQNDCVANLKGSFGGAGTQCSQCGCDVPNADFNNDLDVDQDDFGRLQDCLGISNVSTTAPDCLRADLNQDDQVDAADVYQFAACASGPCIPAEPR